MERSPATYPVLYSVTLVVWRLAQGFVDLYFGCPTILLGQ